MGTFGFFGLGHLSPIFAQSLEGLESTVYQFKISEISAFFGDNDARSFQLQKTASGTWDLAVKGFDRRATDVALSDFRTSANRMSAYDTVRKNSGLLSDWILTFDPRQIFTSSKAQLTFPRANNPKIYLVHFVKAWNDYLARFQEELAAFQTKLVQEGYATTAEFYFSKNLVTRGMAAALTDVEVQKILKNAISDAAAYIQKPDPYDFDKDFLTEVNGNLLKTRVAGSIKALPQFNSAALKVEILPATEQEKAEISSDIYFGKIHMELPLQGLSISIPRLLVSSEMAPRPLQVDESDQLEIKLSFDASQPFSLDAAIVWDRVLNSPQIRLSKSSIKSPSKSLKLSSVRYRGKALKDSGNSKLSDFIMSSLFSEVLTENDFLQGMMEKAAKNYIQELGEPIQIQKTLVAMTKDEVFSDVPADIAVFDLENPDSDPARNPKIFAKFDIQISLRILTPKLKVGSLTNIKVSFEDAAVHLSNLQFYFRGRTIPMQTLGLDFNLISKISKPTTIDANATVAVGSKIDLQLKDLSSNFEALGIDTVNYRFGGKRIETPKFQVNMLTDNSAFFRRQIVAKPPMTQPPLGVSLQTAIVQEVRSQFAERLPKIQIPTNFIKVETAMDVWKAKLQAGILGTSGNFNLPNLRLQEANILFRDLSKNFPKDNSYLISVHANLGINDPMIIRGKDLNFDIKIDEKKTNIGSKLNVSIKDLTAVVKQRSNPSNAELGFDFDIFLKPNHTDLEIRIRDSYHTLDRIEFVELQTSGVKVKADGKKLTDKVLNSLSSLMGWSEESVKGDLRLQRLLEDVLISQQKLIASFIRDQMKDIFTEKIPLYLKSPEVKTALEEGLMRVNSLEDQISLMTWNLGELLKNPLEKLMKDQIQSMITEKLPELNAVYTKQKNVLDESLENLGLWASQDIENILYSSLTDLFQGSSSATAIRLAIDQTLRPFVGSDKIMRDLGLQGRDPDIEILKRDVSVLRKVFELASVIDACPFADPVASRTRAVEKINSYSKELSAKTRMDLVKIVDSRCVSPNASELEGLVPSLYKKGIRNLNEFLLAASTAKEERPSKDEPSIVDKIQGILPLQVPQKSWPTSLDEKAIRDPLKVQMQFSRMELVSPWTTQPDSEIFRVVMTAPQISNSQMSNVISPTVLKVLEAGEQNMVLRLPRTTPNQALAKIDWDALSQSFADKVKIRLTKIPVINQNGQIEFGVSARALLGIGADLDGHISVSLQVSADENGQAKVQVMLDPLQIEKLKANIPFIDGIIRHFLNVAVDSVNQFIKSKLAELGSVPALSKYSNQISLQNILIENGDIYVIARRTSI
ncbi:MAG: hypothetical protein J0L93_10920 [Deltaproteobacteria bacterium]|nr:hypothetical protein [Deltaproteobacteria bacterium]